MDRHTEDHDERVRKRDRKKRLPQTPAAKPAIESLKPDATVLSIARGHCTAVDSAGREKLVRCTVPVAPGDEVVVREERVVAVGPRRSFLARKDPGNPNRELLIAANIDLLIIVAPMLEPPFRAGLVDRYLIAAARGSVQPLLCINKIDLCADTGAADIFTIPKILCSSVTGQGIEELRGMLAGSLVVLAGHSGAGKSSLLNALTETTQARTGELSADTGKGRHTTTSSRLYTLANGGRIIDTPGIREFGLGPVSRIELIEAFPEFSTQHCRFKDCLHRDEPGCAIREAGGPRYDTWLRLTSLA
jgi:ribosome biogenesis GTPase